MYDVVRPQIRIIPVLSMVGESVSSRFKPDYSDGNGSPISVRAAVWFLVMVLGVAIYFVTLVLGMRTESYGVSWQDIGAVMVLLGVCGFVAMLYLDSCAEMQPHVRHVNAEWHPDKTGIKQPLDSAR